MRILRNSARTRFGNSHDLGGFPAAFRALHPRLQGFECCLPAKPARQLLGFEPAGVTACTAHIDQKGSALITEPTDMSKSPHGREAYSVRARPQQARVSGTVQRPQLSFTPHLRGRANGSPIPRFLEQAPRSQPFMGALPAPPYPIPRRANRVFRLGD
jgi:hypothetical protein